MKNIIKSIAIMAAVMLVFGLGAHKSFASGVDFNVGLNFGIPVVAAPVYAPAPVYVPRPVPVYHVQREGYYNGYGYRPVYYGHWRDYRYDRVRHDNGWHRGWYKNHRGWDED